MVECVEAKEYPNECVCACVCWEFSKPKVTCRTLGSSKWDVRGEREIS